MVIYGTAGLLSIWAGLSKNMNRKRETIEPKSEEKAPVKKVASWRAVIPILKKFVKIKGAYVCIFHVVGIMVGIALRVYLTIKIAK